MPLPHHFVIASVLVGIWLTAISAHSPPIVILTSSDTQSKCAGVAVSSLHVLVQSRCVHENDNLDSAFVLGEDTNEAPSVDGTSDAAGHRVTLEPIAIASIAVVPLKDSDKALTGENTTGVHVVTLQSPLDAIMPVTLPLRRPYPVAHQVDENATMITLDFSTLKISRVDDVVYMNRSLCDHQVCTLPSDVDTRHVNQESNHWSFLFKRALNREVYWLLGFGGSPVTDQDGAWGFSWLPQQLSSSSFTDLNITGIKTVTAVTKEYAAPIAYIRENIPYIVGIRSSKTGKSFCTGILVTKYLVLTAAHCMKKDEIRYVAFSAMNGPPRPNFGETIPVSYTIKPLNYRVEHIVVGGKQKEIHYNNILLVQLAYKASRAPIQLITGDPEKVEGEIKNATGATSFGLTIEDNLETLRLTTVSLLSGNDTCKRLLNETTLPPDGSTVCIDGEAKSACSNEAGDGGNPLVVLRGSVFARLIAIGSAGVACQPGKRYSSYTRIYGINPFLNKYMNQLPIPVTSVPAPTKKT